MRPSMALAAFVVAMALATSHSTSSPIISQVFAANTMYPPCFRQPVLVVAGDSLLAFANGRNNTDCSGTHDGDPQYLTVRRSTDNGATFGDVTWLYGGSTADYYVAAVTSSGVHVFLQSNLGNLHFVSNDNGTSWRNATAMPTSLHGYAVKPAVGPAVSLDDRLCGGVCEHHHRLVVPGVCVDSNVESNGGAACSGCHSCLLLSDDEGESWALGAIGQLDTREPAIVQLDSTIRDGDHSNATLYASERNMGFPNATGHRRFAVTEDGGASFGVEGDTSITEPVTSSWTGIVASLARLRATAWGDEENVILYSSVGDAHERANMTVRVSHDEAATWSEATVLDASYASYSSAVRLNATHAAVLYERGDKTFADEIALAVFPITWATGE